MAFYIGDIPAEDIVLEPARDGEAIDLTPFNEIDTETIWRTFDGQIVEADFLVSFDDPDLIVAWPTDQSPFADAGLYSLNVTLVGDERRERLAPVYFVAQGDDGWHTIDSAREEWVTGAPSTDRRLYQLLELAKQQCVAYAPTLADDATVPFNYREGQLMQARNVWNAGLVDPGSGGIGDEDFVIRPFPLDWMVKQILRPKPGMGPIA